MGRDKRRNKDGSLQSCYQLKLLKDLFWSNFRGRKRFIECRSRKKTLGLLKEFADLRVEYKSRMPLAAYRKQFNDVKSERLQLKRYKWCFVCNAKATLRHHLIQLQHGGDNSRRNLISLCKSCHAEIHPWLGKGSNKSEQSPYALTKGEFDEIVSIDAKRSRHVAGL